MNCPHCDKQLIQRRVPTELQSVLRSEAKSVFLCDRCLYTQPGELSETTAQAMFTEIPSFPEGERGIAVALLLGRLNQLALNRQSAEALCEYIIANGVDIYLLIDRIIENKSIEPHYDLQRRWEQFQSWAE